MVLKLNVWRGVCNVVKLDTNILIWTIQIPIEKNNFEKLPPPVAGVRGGQGHL